MSNPQARIEGPKDFEVDPFEGTDYRAVSRLGSGAMGDVFVVEHRNSDGIFAAKLLRSTYASDKRTVDRMRLEADALAKVEHGNVVKIHAYHETPAGLPFIVMELLKGQTLQDVLLANGHLPLTTTLIFALDLLNGLDAVHRIGIVHRDLKPSNLYVHTDKKYSYILKLLDFGAATVLQGISEDSPAPLVLPTRTGTAVGTPLFMSPEAATGQRVDVRSDIYAAANIIYLMLTGRGPFDDCGDVASILKAHISKRPPPLSRFAKEWVPQSLENAIAKGLEKAKERRFQTADEFGAAIYDIMEEYREHVRAGTLPNKNAKRPAIQSLPKPLISARLIQITLMFVLLLASIAIGHFAIHRSLG